MESDAGRHRSVGALIFDLDGTLIDSGADIAAAANRVRRHFDLPELPTRIAIGYVGDGTARLLERVLGHDLVTGRTGARGLPVSETRLAEGLAIFGEYYGRHCLDTTRLYPGVREVLVRFRDRPLMVATNKPAAFTGRILEGLRIAAAFRRVVSGDDVVRKKPHPEALERCLDGLTLDPAAVAVVGDSRVDIEAARALGALAVGVTYGLTPAAAIRSAEPDLVIDRLADLATLLRAP
jgi:phosphoglycolate phosphatase